VKEQTTILLVADDETGREAVEKAFQRHDIQNPLQAVPSFEEAFSRLRKEERPAVVLFDVQELNEDGIERLRSFKDDPRLGGVPLVVLTSSAEEQNRIQSFDLGVAGYIVKPKRFEDFARVIRTVVLYWTLSEVPVAK